MSREALALVSCGPSVEIPVQLPALIAGAGERAAWRFLEFFTVNIRNRNTRAAYGQAAGAFLRWCEDRGITRIEDVQPVHGAGYIEELGLVRKAPTVKQHLAAIGNHSFRPIGITDYMENGGDITVAQRMAGHANIKTTQVYDRREDEASFSEIERVGI